MNIKVKLFAAARQAANQETLSIEIAEGATVQQLKAELGQQFPGLKTMLDHLLVAIDTEYAGEDQVLQAGQDIALIPPVSGG